MYFPKVKSTLLLGVFVAFLLLYNSPTFSWSSSSNSSLGGGGSPGEVLSTTTALADDENVLPLLLPYNGSYPTVAAALGQIQFGFEQLEECRWEFPVTPGRPFDWFAAHMAGKLSFVHDVLQKHQIPWWADFGSLLGIYRHGGQNPFVDWDADFVIPAAFQTKTITALKAAINGSSSSPYFLSRLPPLHFKFKSSYKPTDATRFSVGSTELSERCRVTYGPKYVAVLAPDQPWHLDIRFSLPTEPLPTQFCRCHFYNVTLPCPKRALPLLESMYGPTWYSPHGCKSSPAAWCTQVGTYHFKKEQSKYATAVPIIYARQVDPPGTADELAVCGIHPWQRISSEQTWCRYPTLEKLAFRKSVIHGVSRIIIDDNPPQPEPQPQPPAANANVSLNHEPYDIYAVMAKYCPLYRKQNS